jgi:hypothetical protein
VSLKPKERAAIGPECKRCWASGERPNLVLPCCGIVCVDASADDINPDQSTPFFIPHKTFTDRVISGKH